MPYMRGHVRAPNKDHLMLLSQRHRKAMLTPATEPKWDSREHGWIGPTKDQSQCGECWLFSGTCVVEVAYYKAGVLKSDGSQSLAEQYISDCGNNGGCGGDDNTNVLEHAKKTGMPLLTDYGPYIARPKQCAFKQSMVLYKIDDWGFTDGQNYNTVSSPQSIKDAIKGYGCVGCAVAAGSSWDSWSSDPSYVHNGNSRGIDHDVVLVGWDDSRGKKRVSGLMDPNFTHLPAAVVSLTAWLMRNSWGMGWAWNGYGWILEGADSIGTEAVWASINAIAPPIDVPDYTP